MAEDFRGQRRKGMAAIAVSASLSTTVIPHGARRGARRCETQQLKSPSCRAGVAF